MGLIFEWGKVLIYPSGVLGPEISSVLPFQSFDYDTQGREGGGSFP